MKLFSLFILLLAAARTVTPGPIPPPLINNTYCRDFSRMFKQFGSRCILATHFVNTTTADLSLFDINCIHIGDNSSVPTSLTLNFYSQLRYVVVIEPLCATAPPFFWYAGKPFGTDGRECWLDEDWLYTCSQVFEC